MDDDFNLDDVVGDANRGAYQKTEIRQGLPLAYVAEKLENSVEHMHWVIRSLDREMEESDLKGRLLFSARAAFQQALVSFLALYNLLALAHDPDLPARLLALSSEEFEDWIRENRAEGSLTG